MFMQEMMMASVWQWVWRGEDRSRTSEMGSIGPGVRQGQGRKGPGCWLSFFFSVWKDGCTLHS